MGKFVKGQSGNPNGRPKVPLDIVALCRDFTERGVKKLIEIGEMEAGDDPALMGVQVRAIDSLLNRGWGSAPLRVILAGDQDNPFVMKVAGLEPKD